LLTFENLVATGVLIVVSYITGDRYEYKVENTDTEITTENIVDTINMF